jgi:hypothetical protein
MYVTLVIKDLYVTLGINGTQPNISQHYAECRPLFIVMLSAVRLKVVILSVVAPSTDQIASWLRLENNIVSVDEMASRHNVKSPK